MISAPTTGTSTSQHAQMVAAGETIAVLHRWKKKRLVNRPINFRSAQAIPALTNPIPIASPEMVMARGVVVKSPSVSDRFILPH